KSYINNTFLKRKDAVPEDGMFFDIEKKVALRTIDRLWMDHIDAMMKLRSQVSLQAYGQKDPLIEYKKEAFQMLEQLVSDIDMNTLQTLMRMEFRVQMPREQIQTKTNEDEIVDIETGSREMLPKPVEVESHAENSAKVGRNDPCPCGSEKKYKKCHGR
ncbi:MAG: SEC-C metal-binding domain-containing protein, partial [bacterium]|nr:SEC-C metal-binding domain-containing protein [bacterium]